MCLSIYVGNNTSSFCNMFTLENSPCGSCDDMIRDGRCKCYTREGWKCFLLPGWMLFTQRCCNHHTTSTLGRTSITVSTVKLNRFSQFEWREKKNIKFFFQDKVVTKNLVSIIWQSFNMMRQTEAHPHTLFMYVYLLLTLKYVCPFFSHKNLPEWNSHRKKILLLVFPFLSSKTVALLFYVSFETFFTTFSSISR